jgi:DNA-binding transcriptional ArsR family regulator
MPNNSATLDRVFQALADPTRRAVLKRLSRGPAAMTELARPFDMALPSFAQHLEVLEEGGLVRSRKTGRVRTFEIVPRAMHVAEDWLMRQREIWARRLDQLDTYLKEMSNDED